MPYIKTIQSNDDEATCLICDTTYKTGKPIFPFPSCKCGNIIYFDITEHYVRIGFNWYEVLITSKDSWQKEILSQIAKNGKPNYALDEDEL